MAIRSLLIGLVVIVCIFVGLLFYLWFSGWIWYPRQRGRVTELEAQPVGRADENENAAGLLDDSQGLDSLRMIASHNSYHVEPDWIRRVLIGLAEPEEPQRLRYTHQTLWDQLENGVRSFELDVRPRRNRFSIIHVPLVDSRGPHPDFELAIREVVLWSERHRDHVPIIVLLELKRDWTFLDPGLVEWDARVLERLDEVVRSTVPPDMLLTPDMVRRGAATMVDAVRFLGWPAVGESRGRIVFVVHTNEVTDGLYVADDPTLSGRPMFTSRPGTLPADDGSHAGTSRPDAVFVVHNEPDAAAIADLTARRLIVRTRADGDGSYSGDQRAAALGSTAQIVSTDLPPGHPNDPALGVVEFAPGATLLQDAGPVID